MTDAALIISSPWPRTGSANIVAAQSRYLASRGYRSAMLLSPHEQYHASLFRSFWASTLSEMHFDGLDIVCHSATDHLLGRRRSLSFCRWLMHGRDSQLAIMARYAAGAILPDTLIKFLDANVLRIIVVNHCFQMSVAQKIRRHVKRRDRP